MASFVSSQLCGSRSDVGHFLNPSVKLPTLLVKHIHDMYITNMWVLYSVSFCLGCFFLPNVQGLYLYLSFSDWDHVIVFVVNVSR